MPNIPPILDTPNSRMIYYDLDDTVTEGLLNADETAWQAVSAAILESERGFPDTTIIEVRAKPIPVLSLPCPLVFVWHYKFQAHLRRAASADLHIVLCHSHP